MMHRTTHRPSSNWPEMTGFSSDDHHGIEIGGDYYRGSSSAQVNVKEEQDQPMMGGDDKTSHHKMGIKWARNKLHSFNIHSRKCFLYIYISNFLLLLPFEFFSLFFFLNITFNVVS